MERENLIYFFVEGTTDFFIIIFGRPHSIQDRKKCLAFLNNEGQWSVNQDPTKKVRFQDLSDEIESRTPVEGVTFCILFSKKYLIAIIWLRIYTIYLEQGRLKAKGG